MKGPMNGTARIKAITAAQAVLVVLVVAGAVWLAYKAIGYNQAQQVYRDLQSAYAATGDADEGSPIDFAALQQECPNVVAWLNMPGADIDYPVVQGADNDTYLYADPQGNYNIDGSVFLDYRNGSLVSDLHAIMYAHNMIDGTMFANLMRYQNAEFASGDAGAFNVYTPAGTLRYRVFAVNVVDAEDEAFTLGFTDKTVFDGFVKQLKERSLVETGVDATGNDHILTLSTCSNENRLIVSAKRV